MSVFISHSKHDEDFAIYVKKLLNQSKIDAYLDLFDPSLDRKIGRPEIVPSLQKEIHNCKYLLVILSNITYSSWWVPFEIGIAWETNKAIINCFNYQDGFSDDLPEFLLQWPTIKNQRELLIAKNSIVKENKKLIVSNESMGYFSKANQFDARKFESSLYKELKESRYDY